MVWSSNEGQPVVRDGMIDMRLLFVGGNTQCAGWPIIVPRPRQKRIIDVPTSPKLQSGRQGHATGPTRHESSHRLTLNQRVRLC